MSTIRPGSKTLDVVLETDRLYGHDGLWLGPRGASSAKMDMRTKSDRELVGAGSGLLPTLPGRSLPRSQSLTGAVRVLIGVVATVVVMSQHGDGAQLAVIPTLLALGSRKFFGKDKGDPTEALADNPAVGFVLGALTTGDATDADQFIDSDAVSYANGYEILTPDRGTTSAQFAGNVAFWREHVPDLSIHVFDEVVSKHRHKTQDVAVRFVMSGTLPGEGAPARFSFEGAAFVKVVEGKATEWRLILDSSVMNKLIASIT